MESGKLGYGVRVNCVYPGLVPTEMGNQLARTGELGLFPSPQEAAARGDRADPARPARRGRRHGGRRGLPRLRRRPVHHRRRACRSTAAWACDLIRPRKAGTAKPVIVYGASGYTGRLVCEYLREFNLPFVAAGRDKARMPRLYGQGARHRHRRATRSSRSRHDVAAADRALPGRQVVCNTVGPFAQLGARSWRPASTPAATTWTPRASRTG